MDYNSSIKIESVGIGSSTSKNVSISLPSNYSQQLFHYNDGTSGCHGYYEDSFNFSVKYYSVIKKVTLTVSRDDYANVSLNNSSLLYEVDKTQCRNNRSGLYPNAYTMTYDITSLIKSNENKISFTLEQYNSAALDISIYVEY